MKIVFSNPGLSQPPPVKKMEKTSTTQLKQALEKIKQTQLEVLKVLRSEAETSNLTQTELKQMSQNIEANIPYIKSITNVNLLKIAEINKMRKQMQKEKERSSEKLTALNHRNKLLEQELELKNQGQMHWNNEKKSLIDRINFLAQQNAKLSQTRPNEEAIKGISINYQHQINQKNSRLKQLEQELIHLQQSLRQLSKQKQHFKLKYEQAIKQISVLQKRASETQNIEKSQSKDKLNLPYESLILQIKKISTNHEKIFNNLKIRSRVTISDLDLQEQLQQSFSKVLRLIETSQKTVVHSQDIGKLPDSYSFAGDEMKKLEKEMYESQVMRRSIADLKFENIQLKEDKQSLRNYVNSLELKLKEYETRIHLKNDKSNLQELKEYTVIVEELKRQMEKIRTEKQELSALVKTLSETNIRSPPEEGGLKILRQQLDQIIAINVQLRKENDGLKIMIDGLKLQIQSMRMEERKYEDKIMQKQSIVEKQIHEKDYLVQQLKKYTKTIQEKDINILKQQAKIAELQKVADGNLRSYEQEVSMKIEETKALRQEIDRLMKELRELRQIAHNYQLVQNQNDRLKKNIMQVNSAVIHLWEIKEAEYSNIYSIIEKVRK